MAKKTEICSGDVPVEVFEEEMTRPSVKSCGKQLKFCLDFRGDRNGSVGDCFAGGLAQPDCKEKWLRGKVLRAQEHEPRI